jgi:hypothetical protein
MDFQKDGLTYALMVIPLFFAGTLFAQGLVKLKSRPKEGRVIIGFGVFCLLMIVAAYILFIR